MEDPISILDQAKFYYWFLNKNTIENTFKIMNYHIGELSLSFTIIFYSTSCFHDLVYACEI